MNISPCCLDFGMNKIVFENQFDLLELKDNVIQPKY